MVDSGATTSIIDPSVCQPKWHIKLPKPISIKTAAGYIHIEYKARIPKDAIKSLPIATDCIEFYLYKFHKKFHGLIGMDILKPNQTDIMISKQHIVFNEHIIPIFFSNNDEIDYDAQIEYMNCLESFEIHYSNNIYKQIYAFHT